MPISLEDLLAAEPLARNPEYTLNDILLDMHASSQIAKNLDERIMSGSLSIDSQIDPGEQFMRDRLSAKVNEAIDEYYDNEFNNIVDIPDYILTDPEIVGYEDEQFQNDIYEWVRSDMIPGGSIKDFGCGRGDFGADTVNYIGIDSNQIMVSAAAKKYPGINVICADWNEVSRKTDYTVCIGSLNDYAGEDKWTNFANTLLHAMDTTNVASIFVFSTEYDESGTYYELNRVLPSIPVGHPFSIDCSRYEGICKLVVYSRKFE